MLSWYECVCVDHLVSLGQSSLLLHIHCVALMFYPRLLLLFLPTSLLIPSLVSLSVTTNTLQHCFIREAGANPDLGTIVAVIMS